MKTCILFLLFFFSFSPSTALERKSSAQTPELEAELISSHSPAQKSKAFLLGLRIKIPNGWHSYWSFAGDFGQAPKITFQSIKNVQIRALPFPAPQRKAFFMDKKPAYSFIYEKELLIPYEIFIRENYFSDQINFLVDFEVFICKDLCLSQSAKLKLNLKLASSFKTNVKTKKVFDFWLDELPKSSELTSHFKTKDQKQMIHFSFKKEIKCLDIFPSTKLDFLSSKPVLIHQGPNSCSFQVEKAHSNLQKISGLLLYSQNGEAGSFLFQSDQHKGLSLLWFILMAFLGGLILNIMPCVLPIIFLKFYHILELKNLPARKVLFLNLSYSIGVIISFLFLALFIFISKQTGESLGWGFHLQSPVFITFLAFLFTLIALYLLDLISFPFPRASLLFKDDKLLSHFMTGILSTTAASPCTVPFMAGAVAFAFSRTYMEIFIIFFFLGLGLSFPYLILSFFSRALKYIPTPGPWTNTIKKLFSIPLFLTSLWLIYILYLQVSLKIFLFSLTVFPMLWCWLAVQKLIAKPVIKKIITVVCIGFVLFVFIFQKHFQNTVKQDSTLKKVTVMRDLNWTGFNEDQILFDKQNEKNIFIAFGAEWCLTCKFNERVFQKNKFKQIVRQNQIQLYYGDWTNKTDEITKFLESYNGQGVPFYIFFKGEEKLFIFSTLLIEKPFLKKLKQLSN